MFKDRKEAGQKLAEALQTYKKESPLVFAIPRGGVELGYEISQALYTDFSLLISRKLPFPHNTESGFGAMAEDGSLYINERAASSVSDKEIEKIIAEQDLEIKRRIQTLRAGKALPVIKGRTVILVDDGIAMGSTMHVAVELCKKANAKKIIIAVPVAGRQTIEKFSKMVDAVIVLESPVPFYAVAQVYENWYDVSDEEVLRFFKTQDNT
ncbi:phosphoribosyltransferase [Sulfurovum sp. TSL1]|uniref:phosphoribosyltransferase n=1 Tax=Sulfurovum sp. TSL1 TaxID=2826994 RepID=UPI001CC79E19|nr:phosphoribosyltransferase family protein [Sulfurovum sp. TSL1]GIT97836.1 phosphoribosyltransferase [Sulfurovum sp. TSL1]